MFIVTAKVPRRKLAFGVALTALACCWVLARGAGEVRETAATTGPDPTGMSSNGDRVTYLEAYGWQVGEEPLAVQELVIPKELDESYEDYLALQQSQGFDPAQYAGKRVKRYTYEILNYPTGETGVQANLLIWKKKVIGGEVLSPKPDGLLHGLEMP